KELRSAGFLDAKSELVLEGELLENGFDCGFNTGTAELGLELSLRRGGDVVFQKPFEASHEWDSSFAAAIAVPNGVNGYSETVSLLLAKVFSDEEFLAAMTGGTTSGGVQP
ncbi:MAG: hypothetical protein P1V81_18695, partial [Planctomycetota bacterium]|nr:hypothetical protein [Planctomycetota bacterium]